MSEAVLQGLSLSAVGIGLTFLALGLLIVAMIVLERVFRVRRLVPEERAPKETPVTDTLERDRREEEIVAAIAVALSHLRSLDICRSELGATLESEHGSWWLRGQAQSMSAGDGRRTGRSRSS